jgi:hypothetical protein
MARRRGGGPGWVRRCSDDRGFSRRPAAGGVSGGAHALTKKEGVGGEGLTTQGWAVAFKGG